MGSLEDYAAKGKRLRSEPGERKVRRPWWRMLSERESVKLRESALAGAMPDVSVLGAALLVGALCFGMFALLQAVGAPEPWPGVVGMTAVLPLCVPVILLSRRVRRRRASDEVARLSRLPFAGNWDEYAGRLGKGRTTTVVTLQVRFAEPPSKDRAQWAADATLGMVEKASTSTTAVGFTLKSKALETWSSGTTDGESSYSNYNVHAWVKTALDALTRLHAECPLASVELEIE